MKKTFEVVSVTLLIVVAAVFGCYRFIVWVFDGEYLP